MQTFKITIEEIVSEDFEIVAEDKKTAMEIAKNKYWNAELVLEPGNLQRTRIKITNPPKYRSRWIEI